MLMTEVDRLDLPTWRKAQELEQHLGDPRVAANSLSCHTTVNFDEGDEFPQKSVDALSDVGFFNYLVPEKFAGAMASPTELMALTRVVSRRDLTTAIAIGQTFLGALPVWLGGSDEQTALQSSHVRSAHLGCLALTEKGHGSDVMSSEVVAEPHADGLCVSGEKWLINNGTRGTTLSLLVRSKPGTGMDTLSLLLIDKETLSDGATKPVEKIPTHGIRGADISGIRFVDCVVPESVVMGGVGGGFELMVKTLQISRIMATGFSLGASDSAIRLALDFAIDRQIYGASVVDIPAARFSLIGCLLDQFMAESVALITTRAITLQPSRLTLWSAITKYYVPVTSEKIVRDSGVVLGARHYIREDHWSGLFQKLMRDNAVVSLFDGSTAVNLGLIAGQLNMLVAARTKSHGHLEPEQRDELLALATLDQADTGFPRADDLELSNNGHDEILDSLGWLAEKIAAEPGDEDEAIRQLLLEEIALLLLERDKLDAAVRDLNLAKDFKPTSEARFELAKRYCQLFAAASAILIWVANRDTINGMFSSGEWLELMLARINSELSEVGVSHWMQNKVVIERLWQQFLGLYHDEKMFSIVPFALAKGVR